MPQTPLIDGDDFDSDVDYDDPMGILRADRDAEISARQAQRAAMPVAIQRLIDEVRAEPNRPAGAVMFDRQHNRHNR